MSATEQLAEYDIREPGQLFNVLRSQVDIVLPTGVAVLNAHDPRVVEMAPLCDGEVIFYGSDPDLPTIAKHGTDGGRALFIRDRQIILAQGEHSAVQVELAAMRRTRPGRSVVSEESVLAAVGAAVALNLSPDVIVTGIETFDPGSPVPTRKLN